MDASGGHQLGGGAKQAGDIDTPVLIEAIVFSGQKGIDKSLRHFDYADGGAALFAKLADQLAVAAIDAQWCLELDIAQLLDFGKAGGDIQEGRAKYHDGSTGSDERQKSEKPEERECASHNFPVVRHSDANGRLGYRNL